MITYENYQTAAKLINCEVEAIIAVDKVESGGTGFDKSGRLVILFEPHIFYKELRKRGRNPDIFKKDYPSLLSQVWNPQLYGPSSTQWDKLQQAAKIDQEAAYRSASYGRYQILGQNCKMVGYPTAVAMVNAMQQSEAVHLDLFVKYIKAAWLDDELRARDWAGFARGYNGPLYTKNQYHIKLKKAYEAAKQVSAST